MGIIYYSFQFVYKDTGIADTIVDMASLFLARWSIQYIVFLIWKNPFPWLIHILLDI